MPDWIHVWFWLRFVRDPQVMTPFPQQDWRDPNAMTNDAYDGYRNEWLDAGSPKTSTEEMLGVMTGNPLLDPVPF